MNTDSINLDCIFSGRQNPFDTGEQTDQKLNHLQTWHPDLLEQIS